MLFDVPVMEYMCRAKEIFVNCQSANKKSIGKRGEFADVRGGELQFRNKLVKKYEGEYFITPVHFAYFILLNESKLNRLLSI